MKWKDDVYQLVFSFEPEDQLFVIEVILDLELVAFKELPPEQFRPLLIKHQWSLILLSESIFLKKAVQQEPDYQDPDGEPVKVFDLEIEILEPQDLKSLYR